MGSVRAPGSNFFRRLREGVAQTRMLKWFSLSGGEEKAPSTYRDAKFSRSTDAIAARLLLRTSAIPVVGEDDAPFPLCLQSICKRQNKKIARHCNATLRSHYYSLLHRHFAICQWVIRNQVGGVSLEPGV